MNGNAVPEHRSCVATLTGVTKRYAQAGREVCVLRDVCLDVERGAYVALVGTPGSGKSPLLNIPGLLDTPSSGSYLPNGRDPPHLTDL